MPTTELIPGMDTVLEYIKKQSNEIKVIKGYNEELKRDNELLRCKFEDLKGENEFLKGQIEGLERDIKGINLEVGEGCSGGCRT